MGKSLYALLVGIDAYRAPVPPLRGCVNDIEQIEALIEDFASGGEYTSNLCILKNAQATRAAIIRGFQEHLSQGGPSDVVLFCYSGHGSQEMAPKEFWHLEPDRLDETLVCYDSRESGGWDLADKELAVLISEVSRRGAHVLCVLDCCHSGSGTRASLEEGIGVRRAPTDWRERPIESFLVGTRSANNIVDGSGGGWGVMPTGRHVLLAACRSSETAKEVVEQGKPHGAFTASLLATLRQTRGAISYRDLIKRAEAQVRLRVAQQVPQVEASNPADLQRAFLGGAARKKVTHFTLRQDRDLGWVIDGGAVHGITQPRGGETTSFAIHPLEATSDDLRRIDKAFAVASVTDVRPNVSQVELKLSGEALDAQLTYSAITVSTPLPPLAVYLSGAPEAVGLVRSAISTVGGAPSLLVREATDKSQATLSVDVVDNAYRIGRVGTSRQLVVDAFGLNAGSAQLVVERLEHIARWQAVASLDNNGSRLSAGAIEVAITLPEKTDNGVVWKAADARNGLRLEYTYSESKWRQPRLRIELKNSGPDAVYCALLWLGEDYSISSGLMPGGVEHVPSGSSFALNNGKEIYANVPDDKWRDGQTEVRDLLKLFVSTEQFDPTLFDQQALDSYRKSVTRDQGPRNALERLAKRVHLRGLSTMPDDVIPDWATSEVSVEVVRPLAAVAVPPPGEERDLGAGVAVMGHPSLKAKANLASPTDVGRALGSLNMPAIFRDDPAVSQPFLFELARGTDSGLGALHLTDIQNADAVTKDAPLRIRTRIQLSRGEHVVAYSWDGRFYLPLGIGRQKDGGTEIELQQLPDPLELSQDLQRGIGSSIRILFQKLVSPYLGGEFDYPRLAVASFDAEGEAIYDHTVELVRNKVSAASKILLYVHGILGDTLGMAAASHVQIELLHAPSRRIGDRYDLVLAFDYENIHTGIEVTARALKEKLAMIGLGPDHGKTLHVAAHSMGGLVSRWFIEREQGNQVVQHLVTLGTPHAGSPWPTIEGWATTALALGLNGFSAIAWPAKVLGSIAGAIEKLDVTLDQMAPNSPFLTALGQSADPEIPYTLLVGNTSIIARAATDGVLEALLAKLSPQRVLHAATAVAFLSQPNDIAVAVSSAQAVPNGRAPAAKIVEVACDHITFFSSNAGRRALLEALPQA